MQKIARKILVAINGVWCVPLIIIIRIIKPIFLVRIGVLISSRIGHFIADASILYAEQFNCASKKRTFDLFYIPHPTSNSQWEKMVRRNLKAFSFVRYLASYNTYFPFKASHQILSPSLSGSRLPYASLLSTNKRFEFLESENKAAQKWLKLKGWNEGEKIVCVYVRDSAYLMKYGISRSNSENKWNYHNYRDSDISTYKESILLLLKKGYWVFRMGKVAEKPLQINHPRYLDYPFCSDQNDLIDIWLTINCNFLISTATGIDTLSWVYGKQLALYVNALPLFLSATPTKHVWVPKKLKWIKSGIYLTLREHLEHAYLSAEEYKKADIAIEDLGPCEIADAVIECERRISGTWVDSDDDLGRQDKYWDHFRKDPKFRQFHGFIHPEARVGQSWLKSMGENFFE